MFFRVCKLLANDISKLYRYFGIRCYRLKRFEMLSFQKENSIKKTLPFTSDGSQMKKN